MRLCTLFALIALATPVAAQQPIGPAIAQSPRPVATIAGCFQAVYGPWFPDALSPQSTARHSLGEPIAFELRTDVDTVSSDNGFLVSAFPREAHRYAGLERMIWSMLGSDSVVVYWDPGVIDGSNHLGGQTTLHLVAHGDTLSGIAEMSTDAVPLFGPPWARTLALHIPCDTGVASQQGTTRALLQEWSTKQPLDTALGIARATRFFQELKRADPYVGLAPFVAMIRAYYAAHARLPRIARAAYSQDDPLFRILPPEVMLNNAAGFPYVYRPHGRSFDVIDVGPDGVLGTNDDRAWRDITAR